METKEPDNKTLYNSVRKLFQEAKSKLDQTSYNEFVEISISYKPESTDKQSMLWSIRKILNQLPELKAKLAQLLPELPPPVYWFLICRIQREHLNTLKKLSLMGKTFIKALRRH